MTQPSTPFDLRATREYREFGFQIVNCPVCGKEIKVFNAREASELPWKEVGAEIIIDCSGAYRKRDKAMEHIRYAQDLMVNARPTTAKRIKIITDSCVAAAEEAYAAGERDAIQATFDRIIALTDNRYNKIGEVAKHLVSKFPDEGTVMTQCYAETILGFMCKEIKAQGKKIKFQNFLLLLLCGRDTCRCMELFCLMLFNKYLKRSKKAG